MSCVHIDACLPVTAICTLELAKQRFVLQGCGTELLLLDDATGHVLERTRAFQRNNIHGIQLALLNRDRTRQVETHDSAVFLVWGGASLCIVYLNTQHHASLSILCSEVAVTDWISAAAVMADSDVRSMSTTKTVRAALVTAHNVLMGIEIHSTVGEDSLIKESRIAVFELASGVNSLLYSADITWLSSKQILIAAGTVFGEIVIWSCFLMDSASFQCSTTVIHHLFIGHEGSIFGVKISSKIHIPGSLSSMRLLCSCSDDRTIRVWDIADCYMQDSPSLNTDLMTQKFSTGFGNLHRADITTSPESCIATAFGHSSRIWGVHFLDTIILHGGILSSTIVSRGEDATTQLWNFRVSTSPSTLSKDATLANIAKHHYQRGKNVWSLAVHANPDYYDIYSGAADGSIVSYPVKKQTSSDFQLALPEGGQSHDVAPICTSSRKPKPEVRIVKYAFVSETCILAVSSRSEILLGTVDSRGEWEDTRVSWECLQISETCQHNVVVASDPSSGLALLCDSRGVLSIYNHATRCLEEFAHVDPRVAAVHMTPSESASLSFVSTNMFSNVAHLFIIPDVKEAMVHEQIALNLPKDFLATSAYYNRDTSRLILGGRTGGLAIYDIGSSDSVRMVSPLMYVEHVHGKCYVTSISQISHAARGPNHGQIILTTGRDAYLCVHEVTRTGLLTIHKTSSPFGQFLEGACFDGETGDLIFYGFQSTKFLVWNDTSQRCVLETQCGGAHRSWAYNQPVSIKRRKIFCWTRASTFNLSSQNGLKQRSIRAGGHGREIRATDVTRLKLNGIERDVIATGSEDAIIQLFVHDSSLEENKGSFKCQLTLKKHTTGLQHLHWTTCGNYLFSSGALEEFYVWRVRPLPGFGICAVCEAECPTSSPNSDLRITRFDVAEVEGRWSGTVSFLLCLSYSNSEVKVFSYTSKDSGGTFVLLAQGRYTTNCLTKVSFLPSKSDIHLLTAATDGHIAIWSLREAISPFMSIDSGKLAWKSSIEDLTKFENFTPHVITHETKQSCHQSSIKALSLKCHNPERGQSVIITGGDDNAINIMQLTIKRETSEGPATLKMQNLRKLASAHASAVNAITILSSPNNANDNNGWVFASSSNDQRLKIWRLVMMSKPSGSEKEEGQEVSLLRNIYTPVADVGDINCINENTKQKDLLLLVSGVGMDLWRCGLP